MTLQHPEWSNSGFLGFPNDIAVVRLRSAANTGSPFISTVPLAETGDFIGSSCIISGWGRTSGK